MTPWRLLCLWILLAIIGPSQAKRQKKSRAESNAEMDTVSRDDGGIYWKDLSVESKHRSHRFILQPSSGFVRRGQVCGILGPSGAGKSTLLSALGGTVSRHARLTLHGQVWWQERSGIPASDKLRLSVQHGQVAWLQQHDAFFTMLTTRETMHLAAFLEFPGLSQNERDGLVDTSLDTLGLSSVQHRKIGNRGAGRPSSRSTSGLSGGEQRRLSVALELLTTPHLFLADEPSTGLDSFQAARVVQLISQLAKERHIPCLCTLHQPRTSIWNMLDSIILMAPGGRMCYMGDRHDAVEYFRDLGYPCPPETNPAEFLIDLVSVDTEDVGQAQADRERIDKITRAFLKDNHQNHGTTTWPAAAHEQQKLLQRGKSVSSTITIPSPILWMRRTMALLRRSLRQNYRNHGVNLLRLAASAGNAFLLSQIFRTIRRGVPTARSTADRVALLTFGVINMSMMAVMKTIDLFARERVVVDREQMRQKYSSVEYLVAKAMAELPLDTCFSVVFSVILKRTTALRIPLLFLSATFSLLTVAGAALGFVVGSVTHSAESALSLGMPIMVILMVVGVINPSGVDKEHGSPTFVQWIKTVSPIRWAVEALCVAEYSGMDLRDTTTRWPWQRLRNLPKMGAFVMVRNGEQVLEAIGLEGRTYEGVMTRLAVLSGVNLLMSWMGLHFGGPSFVKPNSNGKEGLAANAIGQSGKVSSRSESKSEPVNIPMIRGPR